MDGWMDVVANLLDGSSDLRLLDLWPTLWCLPQHWTRAASALAESRGRDSVWRVRLGYEGMVAFAVLPWAISQAQPLCCKDTQGAPGEVPVERDWGFSPTASTDSRSWIPDSWKPWDNKLLLLFTPQSFGVKKQWIAAAKSVQLCSTQCDPTDGSPPGSPIPGILQARTLEWVAMSFSY